MTTRVLFDTLGRVTIRSDNRKPKITGLNGVGRVGLRSDNCIPGRKSDSVRSHRRHRDFLSDAIT